MITKILKYGSIAGGVWLVTKIFTTSNALSNLTTKIVNVKNLQLGFDKIQLHLDIMLSNNSTSNLGISTFNLLNIKQIQFFSKNNVLLGVANVNISGLEIEAEKSYILKDILVVIDSPLKNITALYNLFSGNVNNNLKIVLKVDAAGKEYTIDSNNFI